MQCLCRTLLYTQAAPDTFRTLALLGRVHTHFADPFALAAAYTLVFIASELHSRKLIKAGIYCSERAEVSAPEHVDKEAAEGDNAYRYY